MKALIKSILIAWVMTLAIATTSHLMIHAITMTPTNFHLLFEPDASAGSDFPSWIITRLLIMIGLIAGPVLVHCREEIFTNIN
jgi:hypothetical protein